MQKELLLQFCKISRYRNAWEYRLMCTFQNFNLHSFKVKVKTPCVLSKNINISPPKHLERLLKFSQIMLTFPLSSFATCLGGKTKYVSMPFSSRYSHLSPPFPGSSSNSPCRLSLVVWEMCTLLYGKQTLFFFLKNGTHERVHRDIKPSGSYPGIPPDSILFATVTSVDQTSNCHLFWPRTPPSTVPVWTPTRMSTSVLVFSRTYLKQQAHHTWIIYIPFLSSFTCVI